MQAEGPDTCIANSLVDIVFSFNLLKTVTVPTRQGSSSSILDLLFVPENLVNSDFNVEVGNGFPTISCQCLL